MGNAALRKNRAKLAEKIAKKQSLERTEAYLKDYIEENPDDSDAQWDLERIEKELEGCKS